MPRGAVDKPYANFTAGLVTEATGLSYPENSARDLENVVLESSGAILRRFGLNEERDGEAIGAGRLDEANNAVTCHLWRSPGGRDDLNVVCIQVGEWLYFRLWGNGPDSSSVDASATLGISLSLSTTGFARYSPGPVSLTDIKEEPLQSSTGFGRIWFTSRFHYPFYVEFDADGPSINAKYVGKDVAGGRLAIRDFNGIDDGLDVDGEPSVLTAEHLYNLFNQGWEDDGVITDYFSAHSRYPSDAQQWILGKNSSDDFDANLLAKQDFGTSPSPKGRTVLHALDGNRDNVWFVNGTIGPFTDEPLDFSDDYDEPATRGGAFRTTAFFAGRLWLSGDQNPTRPNGVYFSKIIQKAEDAGVLMQENDPTSEHFSDLLDTDGGVIYIEEAAHITKLAPFGEGLLVFSNNGIWYIRGGDSGFNATTYGVDKVSNTGVLGPESVVTADGTILFWGDSSIYRMDFGKDGLPVAQDIASHIESYYNSLSEVAKRKAWGQYDFLTRKVIWLHHGPDAESTQLDGAFRDKWLVLDTKLGVSFTKLDTPAVNINSRGAMAFYPQRERGKAYRLGPGGTETTNRDLDLQIKVVFGDSVTTEAAYLSEFNDLRFMDFMDLPATDQDYESFILTGDEHLGDLQRNKQATFVHSFFDATEERWVEDIDLNLVPDYPSGCVVQFRWDWHRSGVGNRFSDDQQAYRHRRPLIATAVDDPIDNGEGIVYTKLKARGKGRALAIRYSSQSGKDFRLLGFSVAFTASGA